MLVLGPDDVVARIAAGDADSVIGAYETDRVDFKGSYRLTDASDKWELAKDVAAFANNGGGLIAIGFATAMDDDRAEERVTAVKPVPKEMFVPKQVHDIVQHWIYPSPRVEGASASTQRQGARNDSHPRG